MEKCNNKILTISIAAYNVEKYIDELLEELSRCKCLDDIEVLVIDDGGCDNTLNIAQNYSQKYPDVFKAIHKANGGWGSTVNTGISIAMGKYIRLLDGDDYICAQDLEKYVDYLNKSDADMIMSEFTRVDSSSGKSIEYIANPQGCSETRNIPIEMLINRADFEPQMHSSTFKTKVLRENGIILTEHCFYTDVEYLLKSLSFVKTIDLYNSNLYNYRVCNGEQSVSVNGIQKHYKEHMKVCENALELYNKLDSSNCIKNFVKKRIIKLLDVQYRMFAYLKWDHDKENELREFDSLIKSSYPEIYNNPSKKVKSIRIAMSIGCLHAFLIVYKNIYKDFFL